jgi:hypothetical protein
MPSNKDTVFQNVTSAINRLGHDVTNYHGGCNPVKTRCFKMWRRVLTGKDTVLQTITADAIQ